MDQLQYGSRIVYPRMPEPLTESDLASLFTVSPQENHWARTVARKGPSLVVLLTHLKVFQHVGWFLPIADLPTDVKSYVVAQARLEMPADFGANLPGRPNGSSLERDRSCRSDGDTCN
jgi:hypothetical protein